GVQPYCKTFPGSPDCRGGNPAGGYRMERIARYRTIVHCLLEDYAKFSALVAVLPALRSPGTEAPIVSLTFTLAAVLASGFLWTWGATALALRGPLLSAL